MAVQIIKANTVQIMDYYPFGLMWEKQDVTSTDNLKWHHGKELQENEFAQQGKSLDLEDFGARMYDPILGRWWSVDPLAEKFLNLSPFSGMGNNPILFIDPDGRELTTHDGGNRTVYTGEDAAMALMALQAGEEQKAQQQDTDPEKKAHSVQAQESNWYGPSGQINWFLGSTATAFDWKGNINSIEMYERGIRRGLNGNYQLKGRNLNQFKNTRMTNYTKPTSNLSRLGGFIGKVSFGLGVVTDGIGVHTYYKNPNSPNAVHPYKFGLNITMASLGLKLNPVAGALYFGMDAFYPGGWIGHAEDYSKLQKANSAILPGFITAPNGVLKL